SGPRVQLGWAPAARDPPVPALRLPGAVFFQAADGIRGLHVTGVQTCALPIYGECRVVTSEAEADIGCQQRLDACMETLAEHLRRSEERRVGKECRSRRGPDRDDERGDGRGRTGEAEQAAARAAAGAATQSSAG